MQLPVFPVFPLFPLVLEERALRLSGADHRGRRCGFPPGQGRCGCRDPGSLLGFGRADRDLAFRRRCVRPILGRPHDSGRGTRSDCKRRDRRLIGFRGGSGGIIWKGVSFEAVQGVTEDTGYDCAHDSAEPRNLCVKPTAPRDLCAVPGGVKEDLSEVILYPEASFHDPVGHAPGRVEFEDLFEGIHFRSFRV
jgi:hypothetical protein